MPAALDALIIGLYVELDDFLGPRHHGAGRPPKLSDAELITLAVAQVLLAVPNDRQFLALARWRLVHLFPVLIDQSGYNRRLRRLAPEIGRASATSPSSHPAFATSCGCWTPRRSVRPVARDDAPFRVRRQRRLRLLPQPLTLVLGLPALPDLRRRRNADRLGTGCRQPRRTRRRRRDAPAHPRRRALVIADKSFAGRDFEALMAQPGATFLRPDRKDEPPPRQPRRCPPMDRIDLLDLQRPTRPRTPRRPHPPGLGARIGLRLLALAAGIWHNHLTHQPARAFAAYGR